jgi:hypothetical protein
MKAYNDYIQVLKQHKLSPENSDELTDNIMQEIETMQLQQKSLVIVQISACYKIAWFWGAIWTTIFLILN